MLTFISIKWIELTKAHIRKEIRKRMNFPLYLNESSKARIEFEGRIYRAIFILEQEEFGYFKNKQGKSR